MVMLTHSDHEMRKYYGAAMLHFESNIRAFLKRQRSLQNYCGLCLHCWQNQSDHRHVKKVHTGTNCGGPQ